MSSGDVANRYTAAKARPIDREDGAVTNRSPICVRQSVRLSAKRQLSHAFQPSYTYLRALFQILYNGSDDPTSF